MATNEKLTVKDFKKGIEDLDKTIDNLASKVQDAIDNQDNEDEFDKLLDMLGWIEDNLDLHDLKNMIK